LGAGYVFYYRSRTSDPNDILYRLAKNADSVVTDDFPAYLPKNLNEHVRDRIGVPYHVVDASCIVPAEVIVKQQYAAYTIRPKIQKLLPKYLEPVPPVKLIHPWRGKTFSFHTEVEPDRISKLVASSDIDHSVPPSPRFRGGRKEAGKRL